MLEELVAPLAKASLEDQKSIISRAKKENDDLVANSSRS
jgi:hypothetical protein